MNLSHRIHACLSVIGLACGLIFCTHALSQAAPLSDRLVVHDPAGVLLFDGVIPEVTPEPFLSSVAGIPLTGLILGGGVAITGVVGLLEPVGEPLEPGEIPIIVSTPNGQRFLSDIVVGGFLIGAAPVPVVGLYSDGSPDLPALLPLLGGLGVVFAEETGALQDVSSVLPGYKVEVASDVAAIPEPETYMMMLVGLGVLGFAARCRNNASA